MSGGDGGRDREPPPGGVEDGKPYKHGPHGPRTAFEKGERPVDKEVRQRILDDVRAGIDALLAAGHIDKREASTRRRAARTALRSSCLWHCPACDIVYGVGSCPVCGKSLAELVDCDGPEWRSRGAKWDYDPAAYRKLAARLATDLLQIGGPAKGAPAIVATPVTPEVDPDAVFTRTFGTPHDADPTEEESLARREHLIAIWKGSRWARPIVAEELQWRLSQLEAAVERLHASGSIQSPERDRRLAVARRWLCAPAFVLCGCGFCHDEPRCPNCGGAVADAAKDWERHAAPRGRAAWAKAPAVYQLLLAELWADLVRDDGVEPLACKVPPRRRRRQVTAHDGVFRGEGEPESPLADFPPEPLPEWEPSARERARGRGLGVVE